MAGPLVAAQFGEYTGIDLVHRRVPFLPLVAAYQQPTGAAGQIGHVRAPLGRGSDPGRRSRSQRLWSAATREMRELISRAMAAGESASSVRGALCKPQHFTPRSFGSLAKSRQSGLAA